jgi:hypothetical protein
MPLLPREQEKTKRSIWQLRERHRDRRGTHTPHRVQRGKIERVCEIGCEIAELAQNRGQP